MYYSKYFSIFQEASMAGCVSVSDLARYIKQKGYTCRELMAYVASQKAADSPHRR